MVGNFRLHPRIVLYLCGKLRISHHSPEPNSTAQHITRQIGVVEAVGSTPATQTMSNVHNDTEHSVYRSSLWTAPVFVIRPCV